MPKKDKKKQLKSMESARWVER